MLIGCSSTQAHQSGRNTTAATLEEDELVSLRLRVDEQEQELRTVRGQLALARAEVDELRATPDFERRRSAPESGEMEPVLRIDGEVVDEQLPTTSDVPDLPPFVEASAPPKPKAEDASVEGYRRGLRLIQERRFKNALAELDAFATAHPSHPYTDNALFWCGEIHYLRHEYDPALRYFQRIEKLHPWSNKAPDALYRVGQIYLRRGDSARAQAYFDKVREQFPNTAAARLALREDAS
jgi:tol-pal system protein YbgF